MIFFRIAGVILIVLPLVYMASFFALSRTFEYPAILRKPTDYVLNRFADGGTRLIAWWYVFAISAVLIIPMALFFQLVFVETHRYLATSAAVVGALGGLVQAIGLLGWVFVVPGLAKQYKAESEPPSSREAVTVVFRAFQQYAGAALAAHLGSLLIGVWTLLMSSMMFSSPLFGSPLAIMGIVAAVGILARLFEPTGWRAVTAISTIGSIVWSLWLLISGVILMQA